MKTRFNCVAAVLAFAVAALTGGCYQFQRTGQVIGVGGAKAATLEDSMTQPNDEHMHSLAASVDQDAKGFVEDSDIFWQLNRPTRLSRWHER